MEWQRPHLFEEPLRVDLPHVRLEMLVNSDVDWLHETGAAGRDNLELDAETLDGVGNAAKEMDLERVQEQDGNDSDRGRGDIWLEDIINPIEHGGLVEPCLGLHRIFHSLGMVTDLVGGNTAMPCTFVITIGVSISPEADTVKATVQCLLLSVPVRMLMVHAPR